MRLLAGRSFDEHDMKNVTSAVIVNQAFVDAYMRGRDPLRSEVRSGGFRYFEQAMGLCDLDATRVDPATAIRNE